MIILLCIVYLRFSLLWLTAFNGDDYARLSFFVGVATPVILKDLGVQSVRLLTNNMQKVEGLRELGVTVSERVPLQTALTPENTHYLRTKATRMRHIFTPAFLGY